MRASHSWRNSPTRYSEPVMKITSSAEASSRARSSASTGLGTASARRAWDRAVALLRDPSFDVVILDELNVVIKHGYLPLDEVLDELRRKREMLHVVVTGRNARDELIDLADLVTEMKLVKHPYRSGIKAQKGVEF